MSKERLALLQARLRIGVGAGLAVLPRLAARTWIGEDASRAPVSVVTRAMGGRDMALGLGVAIALDRGAPVRGWLEACALADGIDLAATLLGARSLSPTAVKGAAFIAGGSAIMCLVLARMLDQPTSPRDVQAPEAILTGHPARDSIRSSD